MFLQQNGEYLLDSMILHHCSELPCIDFYKFAYIIYREAMMDRSIMLTLKGAVEGVEKVQEGEDEK